MDAIKKTYVWNFLGQLGGCHSNTQLDNELHKTIDWNQLQYKQS
jgi:hypothetical protein